MIVEDIITGTSNNATIFKNFSSFISSITEIKKSRVDEASKLELTVSMYNSTEYSDKCFKTFLRLWQYHRDKTILNNDIPVAATNAKLKKKNEIKLKSIAAGETTKNVEITVPLKYSRNC